MTTLYSAGADSSLTELTYIVETTPGTTPSGNWKHLRTTSETLQKKTTYKAVEELRADGNITDLVLTGVEGGGDINGALIYAEYQAFMESALRGVTASGVLTNGVTRKAMTVQKKFSNGDVEVHRGLEATGMSLKFTAGSEATVMFTTMSRSVTNGTSDVAVSPAASSTNPVYNLVQHCTGFTIGGASYTDGIEDFSLSTNWNPRAQRAIGSAALAGIGGGNTVITGSLTAFFGNATAILAAADSDTPFPIQTSLVAGGNTFGLLLPAVRVTDVKKLAGGANQDVKLAITWQAMLDTVTGSQIKFTF